MFHLQAVKTDLINIKDLTNLFWVCAAPKGIDGTYNHYKLPFVEQDTVFRRTQSPFGGPAWHLLKPQEIDEVKILIEAGHLVLDRNITETIMGFGESSYMTGVKLKSTISFKRPRLKI